LFSQLQSCQNHRGKLYKNGASFTFGHEMSAEACFHAVHGRHLEFLKGIG